MSNKFDKYKKDLDDLIARGTLLIYSMAYELNGKKYLTKCRQMFNQKLKTHHSKENMTMV